MKRRIIAVTILTLSMVVHAYGQNSLTDEFEGMSAKQRTQVAKQEQEVAANDPVFQKLMQEADSLARSRSYGAALDRYREARRQRPYNVRPKVRIQDLEDLIAKAAMEQADEPIPAVPEAIHVPDDVASPTRCPLAQNACACPASASVAGPTSTITCDMVFPLGVWNKKSALDHSGRNASQTAYTIFPRSASVI